MPPPNNKHHVPKGIQGSQIRTLQISHSFHCPKTKFSKVILVIPQNIANKVFSPVIGRMRL